MPELTEDGRYAVTLKGEPEIEERNWREDPGSFDVLVYGETEDGYGAHGSIQFGNRLVTGGNNAGMTQTEAATDLLESLGVEDGYLGNLGKAIEAGIKCQFYVANKAGSDGKMYRNVYVNPLRRTKKISKVNVDELLAKLKSPGAAAPPPFPAADQGANPF